MIRKSIAISIAGALAFCWLFAFVGFTMLHEHFYAMMTANDPLVSSKVAQSFPAIDKWPVKFHQHLLYILLLASLLIDVLLSATKEWLSHVTYLTTGQFERPSYGKLLGSVVLIVIGFVLVATLYSSSKPSEKPDMMVPVLIFIAIFVVKFIEYYKLDDVFTNIEDKA
jgi:hypothetical protein